MGVRKILREGFRTGATLGVSKAARAFQPTAGWVLGYVEDDVVVLRICHAGRDIVEVELMADLPSDDMIGTGLVATESKRAHNLSVTIVKR